MFEFKQLDIGFKKTFIMAMQMRPTTAGNDRIGIAESSMSLRNLKKLTIMAP